MNDAEVLERAAQILKDCGAKGIDPFRGRQVPAVAGRFLKERNRHQRQADLMWLGTLVALFSDHELKLLDDLGFLSQHDNDLLRQAGRVA